MFGDVYRGKKVLLTGHTGFKGSWLSIWLKSLGADVTGYALAPSTDPSLFSLSGLQTDIDSHIADIRDLELLKKVFQEKKPEIVFHLAAQPLVRLSYTEPVYTMETNIMGTIHLMEAVRHCPSVRVCEIITSDKCYENREWIYSYRENDAMGGHDPYSASKGCAELAASSYMRSFFPVEKMSEHGVSVSTARAGNVVGGGDWSADRLIPDFVRALTSGEAVELRNPGSVRPWQHVLEPLSGYLALAAAQYTSPADFSGSWNFGPDAADSITVQQITEMLIEILGEGKWLDGSKTTQPHEANLLKLECTKAKNLLKWQPAYNVRECMRETASWYSAWWKNNDFDAKGMVETQIANYTDKAAKAGIAWAS